MCNGPRIAIDERVILTEMKEVRGGHRGNRSVQEFTAKCCLWRGHRSFKPCGIAKSMGAAIALNLLLMHFEDFIQRKEQGFHHSFLSLLRQLLERLRITLVRQFLSGFELLSTRRLLRRSHNQLLSVSADIEQRVRINIQQFQNRTIDY